MNSDSDAKNPVSSTILYVDTDATFSKLFIAHLEQSNRPIEITWRTDGLTALKVLESSTVDCVVCEYSLPDLDGLEMVEVVRSREPTLPFILFTNSGSEIVASEAIFLGVTDYIIKHPSPDIFSILERRIDRALGIQHSTLGSTER